MTGTTRLYGPYVHTLNKGGLKQIALAQKLRGATASNHMANDHAAVRAYVGTFEHQRKNKNWSSRESIHLEFMTTIAPRSDLPPGYAEWGEAELQQGYLPIQLTRVLNGAGELVTY